MGEFVGFALQLQKLIVNLAVLALDAAQKGRDLVVGVCIERVVQIDGVERLDDAAGKAPGKKRAENYGGKRNNQNGWSMPRSRTASVWRRTLMRSTVPSGRRFAT